MSLAYHDNLLDDDNLPWEDATDELSNILGSLSLKEIAHSPKVTTTASPLKRSILKPSNRENILQTPPDSKPRITKVSD